MDITGEIDLSSMRSMINAFPDLIKMVELNHDVMKQMKEFSKEQFRGICILGMGGSGIAGNLCKEMYSDEAYAPIICVSDYILPKYVTKQWIVIGVSYSGNTEETISAFEQAVNRGCPTISITTGGRLEVLSEGRPICYLPIGFQPRAAFPLLISVQIQILETILGLIPTDMKVFSKKINSIANTWKNTSISPKIIANEIVGGIPLFIGWQHLSPVAYRAKCQINENAKTVSFFSVIPENNHNEIEGTGMYGTFQIVPIFLRSKYETTQISKRFDATERVILDEGVRSINLRIETDTKLEELVAFALYVDMISIELADIRKVDSVSVERIASLKRILSE